jgi:hypothetical protein
MELLKLKILRLKPTIYLKKNNNIWPFIIVKYEYQVEEELKNLVKWMLRIDYNYSFNNQ